MQKGIDGMKEKDYNKWLKAKREVEHFDELDDDVKKNDI